MATFSLEDTVKTFTYHQALVVYWFCKGLSNENIAARYGYEKSWVVWQMSFVYFKLGLDRKDASGTSLHWTERRRIIQEKICPIIEKLTNDDPELLERFPLIPPNVLQGNILDLRPEIPVPPSEPFIPLPEPPPSPPPLPPDEQIPPKEPPSDFYPIQLYNAWLAVLEDDVKDDDDPPPPLPPIIVGPERGGIMWGRILALGSAVLLGCAAVGVLAYWLGQQNTPTPTPILASATLEILATETLLAIPTDTSIPAFTATPTQTSIPETPTSTPTKAVTPKPPALFETSFESGLPAGMEMVYGDIDFVNEELVAHDFTLLAIGEDTWQNYQVEYDARKHTYCFGLENNGISAHTIGPENMIMWSWNYCESGWFKFTGKWETISFDDRNLANPGTVINIRLVAEGGNFTVYVNSIEHSSYFDEKYLQGKAYLYVSDSSVIDNVRVSELP